MTEIGLSQTELAKRCNIASADLFCADEQPNITRERIAKILMRCKANPRKSAARVITHQELLVLAAVLQVSVEWLTAEADSQDLLLWDLLAEPQRASHLLHLMNEHEQRSSEVLVWAEYPICSLATAEFTHELHEAIFSELDAVGAHQEKRKLVQIYDDIGAGRRKRVLESRFMRRQLIQLIFATDLERMMRGESEYSGIRASVRKACMKHLCTLVSEPSFGVHLVIVDDEGCNGVKAALRDYDSLSVFDECFVLWRHHSGRVAWSEHPGHSRRYRSMLKGLQTRSGALSGMDAVNLIDKWARSGC
jgi:hypothetical protein